MEQGIRVCEMSRRAERAASRQNESCQYGRGGIKEQARQFINEENAQDRRQGRWQAGCKLIDTAKPIRRDL